MKAIKKAYGKENWLDTRHSRHYLKSITNARISFNIRVSAFVAGANALYRNILHTSVEFEEDKKTALANHLDGSTKGLSVIHTKFNDELILIGHKYGVLL